MLNLPLFQMAITGLLTAIFSGHRCTISFGVHSREEIRKGRSSLSVSGSSGEHLQALFYHSTAPWWAAVTAAIEEMNDEFDGTLHVHVS
jgi:hypothetical protein